MNKKQIFTVILVAAFTGSVFAGSNKDLLNAVKKNNKKGVKNALKAETDDKIKGQALIIALYQQNKALAQTILESNPAVNVTNENGATPLMFAAIAGYEDIMKELIKKGAEVNAQDNEGRTALMIAAEKLSISIAKLLLNNNADKALKDKLGHTVLEKVSNRPIFLTMGYPEVEKIKKMTALLK